MTRRMLCERGTGASYRCRRTATRLVTWPASVGGTYRCDAHASELAALIVAAAHGPVGVEAAR